MRELAPLSDDRCFGIERSELRSSRAKEASVKGSFSEWDEVGGREEGRRGGGEGQ